MTCATALGWSLLGIICILFLASSVVAVAAAMISGRISREEEGDDIYCAPEGGVTRIRDVA